MLDIQYLMLDNECQTVQTFIEYRVSGIEYQVVTATNRQQLETRRQTPATGSQ